MIYECPYIMIYMATAAGRMPSTLAGALLRVSAEEPRDAGGASGAEEGCCAYRLLPSRESMGADRE